MFIVILDYDSVISISFIVDGIIIGIVMDDVDVRMGR